MFLLRILFLAFLWQRLCSQQSHASYGEETKQEGYYQFAVRFNNKSYCDECAKNLTSNSCLTNMRQLWKKTFPNNMYTVQRITTTRTAECLKEGDHNLIILILKISYKVEGNGTELEHMLNCSGHLESDQPQSCSHFVEPTSEPYVPYLIAFGTVFVVVVMLLLVVLTYWKREKVMAFTKRHWAAQCRHQDPVRQRLNDDDEILPAGYGSTADGSRSSLESSNDRLTRAIDKLESIANRLEASQSIHGERGLDAREQYC